MRARVAPTGVERTFDAEQIIVSKTDTKGVITYANRTFAQVSGYSEPELLGSPHSLVRHPDMPRGVFRFMWEEIQAGREIFAYVVNLAADGAHYWVLAHVTPSRSRTGSLIGFHSNRRRPDAAAVAAVSTVYRDLRDVESRHAGAREQAAAGQKALLDLLREQGLTYSQFVWSLIGESAA